MNLQKKLFNKRQIKDFLMINLGVFLMAIAYSVFIDPNNLVIGGVGGIATLLKDILTDFTIFGMHITSSFIILIFNGILLVFAFLFIGKSFFLKTLYASIIYPVYIFILELVINLLGDKFINLTLIANNLQQQTNLDTTTIKVIMAGSYLVFVIFGAVISGIGLGLALKRGASTGGVDIIQQIFLKYFKIPFSASLIIIDGTIVLSACFYFQDLFTILYGISFILISGFVLDSIAFSGFNSRAVNIITKEPLKIKQKIFEVLKRGVTEVYARSGYEEREFTMIVCIMSNKEFYKLKSIILEIDSKAFIYVTRASEVHGEGFSYDSPQ